MSSHLRRLSSTTSILALLALIVVSLPGKLMAQTQTSQTNKEIVEKAFDNWRTGKGSVYDFLADDAQWTIAGASLAAGTYNSKEEFFDKVIRPFNARVKSPLSPTIREIHTSGDTVVVLFDASTTANDGVLYKNTYAWFLQLRDGRVVKATAFFDTKWFDEFWIRVKPASAN